MKGRFFLLCMLLMSLICQPCVANGYLLGDTNGDGVISIEDIVGMVEIMRGENSGRANAIAGDIDQDGTVSLADIFLLSNIITRKNKPEADTLFIYFKGTNVVYSNPYPADMVTLSVSSESTDFVISNNGCKDFVISVQGASNDGRLHVNSNVEYTLKLNGASLTSSHAPAFNSITSEKVKIELADNTTNSFCDAKKYTLAEGETASGCFNSMGQMTITGNGTLNVHGNNKHAIYSKKSITVNSGIINIGKAVSDAIHSGKHVNIYGGTLTLKGMDGDGIDLDDNFTMTNGTLNLDITGEAAKGIKCCGVMNISGGTITATASGALKNKNGNLSYCTILKCDSNMIINGGVFHLINNSPGGKCLSINHSLTINGGTIYTETNGDGAQYTNTKESIDYYTSKCITAHDSIFIRRGCIQCLSTGIGGKGIVGDKWVVIGVKDDINYCPELVINTEGSSIVNDTIRDERYGCPKGIKAGERLYVYGGNCRIGTEGIGGEGLECKGSIFIYGGNTVCNTFDDGINAGVKMHIFGGSIFCNSINNDGIDSNGRLSISGGHVMSISQQLWGESFDSDEDVIIIGGVVWGIGKDDVHISDNSITTYNTIGIWDDYTGKEITGWEIGKGKYYHIMENDYLIMSFKSNIHLNNVFQTICNPNLIKGKEYSIFESDRSAISPIQTVCDGYLTIGGEIDSEKKLLGIFTINK